MTEIWRFTGLLSGEHVWATACAVTLVLIAALMAVDFLGV